MDETKKGQEFQIGRLSLITEKSNSLIILSIIILFSFSPYAAYLLCSSTQSSEAHWLDYKD
ncbi:hypothetical protein BpHYR1_038227 [Brachionus plicatilis]|uniref:Uncharacterized protein n=1 Tax=Brachionus plicatilis TaxID=10195 RepID=A0A3M7SIM8_BRAPC|nr:hypothetical protein BpHYR1_038227 [Brachionus plicatilis]